MELLLAAMMILQLEFKGDAPVCYTEPWLMGAYDAGKVILCESNIVFEGDDSEEILRHELLHVAQHCVGGLLNEGRDYLSEAKDFPHLLYDPVQWDTEAEARILAAEMTSEDVSSLIIDRCLPTPPW